jgi:hypothetical protein
MTVISYSLVSNNSSNFHYSVFLSPVFLIASNPFPGDVPVNVEIGGQALLTLSL